jgi:subtilisin-like proprotein convertase family protein
MKNFKGILAAVTLVFVLGGGWPAQTALAFSNGGSGSSYTVNDSPGVVIPDNNPSGVAYSINFAASGLTVGNITVSINLSGGYNGDIYAYLSHGSQISTLLNGPSPGLSGSAMNLTFVEGTGSPIPTTSSANLSGNYTAYTDLATFNNTAPNGNWTLFFADLSPGDTSTLNSFSIDITAVPEPVNVALVIFGGLLAVWSAVRWRRDSASAAASN